MHNERRCIQTYIGHKQAVRDINFNNDGTRFLSAGKLLMLLCILVWKPTLTFVLCVAAYDRYIKLWDTETGECISRFTNRKVPYCVKFHPDEDKQHLFVAGTSDKKIVCVS